MKIGERDDFLETRVVELMDGVSVVINGLPFGSDKQMEEDLPSPVAPKRPKYDSAGKPIYRNKAKKTVEFYHDEDDPKFKKAEKEQNRRQSAWMIFNGTKKDRSLCWDARPEDFESKEQFFQAIYDELMASNIGAGYILRLIKEILELSGMAKSQVERAKEAFLSTEAFET